MNYKSLFVFVKQLQTAKQFKLLFSQTVFDLSFCQERLRQERRAKRRQERQQQRRDIEGQGQGQANEQRFDQTKTDTTEPRAARNHDNHRGSAGLNHMGGLNHRGSAGLNHTHSGGAGSNRSGAAKNGAEGKAEEDRNEHRAPSALFNWICTAFRRSRTVNLDEVGHANQGGAVGLDSAHSHVD